MSEPQSSTVATNTLTITNLEAPHFEKETMLRLKALAETFGEVYYFAPIKSFYRVFVVYLSTGDAQRAKDSLHNTDFEGTAIRVYFGQHTEISIDPSRHFLHPPELEKNWLISPPGSPPVGWSQVREDPPNTVHLADDLVRALIELGQPVYQLPRPDGSFADRSHLFESVVDDFSLDDHHSGDSQSVPETSGTAHSSGQDQGQGSQTQDDNEMEYGRLPHQLRGLKIDTQARSNDSPVRISSCHSPASSLFPPQTPTVQVFSPSKEAEGDQPFITVQDWGMEEAPQPLRRRGTIPKTAFPTGPVHA